eukprot:gene2045-1551_t
MTTETLKNRSEIKQEDKWNVEAIFATNDAWKQEFSKFNDLKSELEPVLKLKGKIESCSPSDIKTLLESLFLSSRKIEKLYTYSHLKFDEDTADDENKGLNKQATTLYHEFNEATSWLTPELLSLPKDKIDSILNSKELENYKFYLEKIVREKAHICSSEIEEVLAQAGDALGTPTKVFGAINNSDFEFGTVLDKDGNEKPLSHGTYGLYIRNSDRVLRKNAFVKYHSKFDEFKNTLTETLNGVVQKHVFNSKVRKYQSSLEAALFGNNIDTSVYTNLIQSVRNNISSLHRYVKLRKKLLKVDELHLYDLYVPLTSVKSSSYDYKQAEIFTIEAVKYLGEDYQKKLEKGLKEDRWVDVYENKGKRNGAYSSGCFDTSPYILMNYNGSLNDVFTLTHECGHSMHSLLSRSHQDYHYSDYSIFVAEVASTFNEDNLRDYLLKKSQSKDEKIYLINSAIEDIRTTLFRQVMFAEFELKIHELVEKKTPLTPKLLKDVYHELNQFYFGDEIVIDSEIDIEWARVPHFYYNFYVYQYATGIAAAVYLADKVRNGGDKEREAYLSFLKGGSSKYPLDMLKVAGVDMTKSDAIDKTMEVFTNLIDEFEKLTSEE